MQNKGAIWLFTILLALACIYQLSFTFVASGVESDAKAFANGNEDLENRYLDSMRSEKVYPVLGFTYGDCKEREINLGLDLKGGMNVTLEVSVPDILAALAADKEGDENFKKALARARELQKQDDGDFVTLFAKAYKEVAPNAKLVSSFYSLSTKDRLSPTATDEEVAEYLKGESEDAISQSFNVLRTRVNQFGVAQPNIQKLIGTDRIQVELPGVKDKNRVRKLLQGTANLEFWETYENQEVYPLLEEINTKLRLIQEGKDLKKDTKDSTVIPLPDDTTAVVAQVTPDSLQNDTSALNKLMGLDGDTTKSLDDLLATSEDTTEQEANPLFEVMRPAIFQDANGQFVYGQGCVVGYVATKDTGKVNKYLKMKEIKALLPPKMKLLWFAKAYDEEGKFVQLAAMKASDRDGSPALDGDVIVDAYQDYGQFGGSPEVIMVMDATGAQKWKAITGANVGKSVAIAMDGLIYTAPTVNGEIAGGRSSISGNFEVKEAQDLANVIKAGKMPAPARIVEEAIVGPSLGAKAISSGLMSFMLALVVVLLYMIFYYNKAGVASNVALLANLFFIIGALASTNIALTLPGIAGIVLTIGMAVDANVLIYERIREELRAGKTVKLAIEDGYKNSYSSILDANITSLLTGLILWFFGTGPIEGFAKALVVGILTSLFSAIFITRLIFQWQLDKKKVVTFATKITENAFQNVNIAFINKRKLGYIISSIIIIAGIGSMATRGLDYGVDFTGGRNLQVSFDKAVVPSDIGDVLQNVFLDKDGSKMRPEVKTYGDNNQVMIATNYLYNSDDPNAGTMVEDNLKQGLIDAGYNPTIESVKSVGPTIADDIKRAGMYSVFFALLVIFLYIVARFRRWQFGLGAIAAIFHDVLIVLSIFSLLYGFLPFSLEIDQAFIAAILTVVGYSINDTVVVFDRIREYLASYKKQPFTDVVNNALNSTLSRTINTSLTTFFVLLMIFIFGGEVIRGFIFALLIGIIVGTYSSVFVASPIAYDLLKGSMDEREKK